MYIVYRYICVAYLQRLVEQTGSSTAVQEVVVLLHVAVREPLGQVETVNAKSYSDYSVGGGGGTLLQLVEKICFKHFYSHN